jgi:hypothetical protein
MRIGIEPTELTTFLLARQPQVLMTHALAPTTGHRADRPSAVSGRTPRKFVIALVSGILAAGILDLAMSKRLPVAVAPVAEEQRYDPQGPLDTLPASALCKFADDENPEIRCKVIDELGRRGAIVELVQLLRHPRADVREHIPQALLLSSQAAHDQIPLLVAALESADETSRQSTAEALLVLVRAHGPYRGPNSIANRPGAETH